LDNRNEGTYRGFLGSGDVAKALAKGLKKHAKEVRIGSRSAEKLAQFGADAGLPPLTSLRRTAHTSVTDRSAVVA
jgi:pyrroline-5-carboxylate reductase